MTRARLNRSLVVQTAADLADEWGWAQLTLSSVAQAAGVRQPSLYKHIESLAALRRGVSILAVSDLGTQLMAAVAGRSDTEALQAIAATYRMYAHDHPGRYAASVVAPNTGDEEHSLVADRIVESLAAVMHGYGLAGDDAVHAIRALRAQLHGFVSLEAFGGFAMKLDLDESYRIMVEGFDAALRNTSRDSNAN